MMPLYNKGSGIIKMRFILIGSIVSAVGYTAKKRVDDWQCFKDGLFSNPSNHTEAHKS